jgi:outer membrane receptor protein involved in Fe transport
MFSNTFNPGGSLAQQYDQLSIGDNSFEGLDASINYQLGFKKKKDQLLTLSYKFSYSPNTLYNSDIFTQRLDLPFAEQANFLQNNQAGERSHTLQVDYAEPFKYITLEAGGKAILRTDYSNFQRSDQDSVSNQYALNPIYTDIFNYNQDVYSLYNSYQLKAGSWTGKAGLRLEHTSINGDFISVNTPINQSYSNLIPSVSIQRSFKTNSLTFGFTQRIQRPGIFQLNPFVDNSNPKFISTGNPNLRPELNNTFELNYSNLSKKLLHRRA